MEATKRSLGKEYARYVSQNIVGMLGISCYILADTFFISKAAGANGITVLNLCLPVYNIIFAIGSMIAVGSATRFAIARAQRDNGADRYFSNAIFSVLLLSIPFTLAGIFAPGKILTLMGGDAQIVSLGIPYAGTFLHFSAFFMLNYVLNAFVRNDNDPFLSMVATFSGSIFNIIFDYIFMFPMHMGLRGAALATAISPIVSIGICLIHFIKKKNTIRILWKLPSVRLLLQSCLLGLSAFVGEFSAGVTTTVFNFLILGLAGNVGVAAYGIIANLAIVATAIYNGIAQGSQPLYSFYYGKGEISSGKKILKYGIGTSLVFSLFLYFLVYAGTDGFIAVFNSEGSAELAGYAFSGLRYYFLGFFFAGINIIATGYLSATNQAGPAAVASVSRGLVAIIGCAFLLAWLLGMTGVWLAFPAAELVTLLIIFCVSRKKNRNK